MNIGIIGTGLSGYGAYLAIKHHKNNFNCTFLNYGDVINNIEIKYKKFVIPSFPKKTEFNFSFSSVSIEKTTKSIRISNTIGGLSDFWSCSAFPFSNQEIKIRSLECIEPFYKDLGKYLRISGNQDDHLNLIFKNHFLYRNVIHTANHLNVFNLLNNCSDKFKFTVGNNRVLLSSINSNDCIYCGDCFKGCPKDLLLRPSKEIVDVKIKRAYIERIAKIEGYWYVYDKENILIDKYDALFLGLGVYETIKLLIRSNLVEPQSLTLYDSNAIFFPIFLKNDFQNNFYDKNFGYANKVISIQDNPSKSMIGHILISPFNHFFTYTLFGTIVGYLFKGIFFKRIALATFYSESSLANSYSIDHFGKCSVIKDNSKECKNLLHKIIDQVNLLHIPFKFLKIFKNFDSSSHYSSNLLDKNLPFLEACQFKENLFVIDGNLYSGPPSGAPGSLSILTGAYAVMKNFIMNSHDTSKF
jgi:ferredoxin